MGKLVIVDECLIPRRIAWLYYKGPNPTDFLKNFRTTLRFQLDVSTTRSFERKFLWDYTADPIRFYDEWETRKELSRFTEMWISIRALGFVSKAKKDGDFSLELYGEVRHKFEPSNWFMKYIWLLYNYLFYAKLRDNYTRMCRDYINGFMNWCKEKYGMKTVTTPEATLEQVLEEQQTEKFMRRAKVKPAASEPEKAKEGKEAPPEEQKS
jgi:hypothetical protein